MEKKIKFAQIGMGHDHAGPKMATFRSFPQYYEVMGVAEPSPADFKAHCKDDPYRDVPVMTVEEVLNIPGLEAVLIENDDPADMTKYAQMCIDRGLHIQMDKPAGEKMSLYQNMMDDAKRKGLLVQMGYMYRGNPAIQYAVEMARSGKLGRIHAIDAQMSTSHPEDYRHRYAYVQGGAMMIFGCHLVDLIVRVMGEPVKVHSFMRKTCTSDAYDNTLAVLEYPDGVCTVRVNSLEVNGWGRRQFVVCGTEGTEAVCPLENPTVIHESLMRDMEYPWRAMGRDLDIPITRGRYDQQAEEFFKIIRGQMESPYSYEHDLAVHRTTLLCCGIDPDR